MGETELSQQDIDALLTGGGERPQEYDLPAFDEPEEDTETADARRTLDALLDVSLELSIELGRTTLNVEDILRLKEGAVVELDKLAGDPINILANGVPVARGEVVVLNDNFCIRITNILTPEARLDAIK
jgi:flagellar motor switch protein FliN/FliY